MPSLQYIRVNPSTRNSTQTGGLYLQNKHFQFGGALTKGQQYRKTINRRQELADFRNRNRRSRYDEFNDIIAQAQLEASNNQRNTRSSNTYTSANDLPPPSRSRSMNSIVASSIQPPPSRSRSIHSIVADSIQRPPSRARSINSIVEDALSQRARSAAPSSATQVTTSGKKPVSKPSSFIGIPGSSKDPRFSSGPSSTGRPRPSRDFRRNSKRSASRSLDSIINDITSLSPPRPSRPKNRRLTTAAVAKLPSISSGSTSRTPSSFGVSQSGSPLSGEYSEMSESEPEMPPPPSERSVRRATNLSNREVSMMMQTMRGVQPDISNKNLHNIISGWHLHGKNVGMEKNGSPAAVRRLFNLIGQKQASDPNSHYRRKLSRGEELDFDDEYYQLTECFKVRRKQNKKKTTQKGGMIGVAVPAAYITAAKIIAALAPAAVAAGAAGKVAASSVASAAVPAVVQKALDRRSEKD